MSKLDIHSVAELTKYAIRQGGISGVGVLGPPAFSLGTRFRLCARKMRIPAVIQPRGKKLLENLMRRPARIRTGALGCGRESYRD
jgi:hypothetical protein